MGAFRATYTTAMPKNAETFTRKGKKLARWKARGGTIEGEVLENGRVKVTVTDVWYMRYVDADGKKVREPGYSDKEATEAECRRRQTQADRIRAGLEPREAAAHAGKSLSGHLADYTEYLTAKGRNPTHVATTTARVAAAIAGTGAKTAGDLTETALTLFLSRQTYHRKGWPRPKPIGASTRRAYVVAVKAFLGWLSGPKSGRRVAANPLAGLRLERDQSDVRRRRRTLTDAEFAQVVRTAEASQPRSRRSNARPWGEARAVLYLAAAYTGFRAEELARLTPAEFDLAAEQPSVSLFGDATKSGDDARQALPGWLVPRLRAFLADRPAGKPVWPGGWYRAAAKMLRRDLERCTPPIPYRDGRGQYADFHSLRRTYIGKLADAGVDVKTAQRLARHSSITLTHDVYRQQAELRAATEAVNRLPPMG